MHVSIVIFCICLFISSAQRHNDNHDSSSTSQRTCMNIGLWSVWSEVNSTQTTDDVYPIIVQIANNTCTVPINVEIQLYDGRFGNDNMQRSLLDSSDFIAVLSFYAPFLSGRDFRVRFCCEKDSFINTTSTTTTTNSIINTTTNNSIENSTASTTTFSSTKNSTDTSVTNAFLTALDGITCGKQAIAPLSGLMTRIFGGTDAIANSWPWMINFRQKTICESSECYVECGGTLISKDYVITAAHCISTTDPSDIILIAGMHQQSSITETDTRQVRTVQEINIHPRYNPTFVLNDIAILRVNTSFIYTTYVQPACLPGPDPQAKDSVIIIGWGSQELGGTVVDTLQQVYTTIVGNCNYYWSIVSNKQQICVANTVTGASACQGDSGGPILSETNGQYIVSGVASYVYDCNTLADGNTPNVYTRVSAYTTWIKSITT